MSASAEQSTDHDQCTGHVQLGLFGKYAKTQLMVTHARVIVSEDVEWIPANTYYDGADLLTVRQVSERTFLTLEEEDSRPCAAHIVLLQNFYRFDGSYNHHTRSLVIARDIEQDLILDMATSYMESKRPVSGPTISREICFDRDPDELLGFMRQIVDEQSRSDKYMDRALQRGYFMLGEPRPWNEVN